MCLPIVAVSQDVGPVPLSILSRRTGLTVHVVKPEIFLARRRKSSSRFRPDDLYYYRLKDSARDPPNVAHHFLFTLFVSFFSLSFHR
jgi:hypothetical protein